MLITICDLPEERRSDVERSGGEVRRIWDGLMDAQFKEHTITGDILGELCISPTNGGASFRVLYNEYGMVYIQ